MNHILVFAFLITVLVGTWAAFAAWQRYRRYRHSQTWHLLNYVVAFNVMAFGYLTAQYAFTNLIGFDPLEYPRFVLALSVGVFPIEAWLSWTALRLGWDLRCRGFSVGARRAFAVGVAAFGVSYVVGLTLLLRDGGMIWLVRTHMMLGFAMTAVMVVAFLGLAVCRGENLTNEQKRWVRLLGRGLLLGHLVLPGSVALPGAAHLLVLAAALFWLNCVPLLWLRLGFDIHYCAVTAGQSEAAAIAALASEHGITRREREVMELIARGMSNKEIEQELCISFSTVKNHAYSLYRKLGVTSRAQVIHRVLDRRRDSTNSSTPQVA